MQLLNHSLHLFELQRDSWSLRTEDLARSTVSSKTDIGKCFSFMVFLFWTLKQKFKTKYILQAICDEDQGQHGCSLFIVGPMRTGEGSK